MQFCTESSSPELMSNRSASDLTCTGKHLKAKRDRENKTENTLAPIAQVADVACMVNGYASSTAIVAAGFSQTMQPALGRMHFGQYRAISSPKQTTKAWRL